MTRKAHRKSRNGCMECKRRRIKCDEKRPQCTNCCSSQRECRFPSLFRPSTLGSTSSSSAEPLDSSAQNSASSDAASAPCSDGISPPVNVLHAELLYFLTTETVQSLKRHDEKNELPLSTILEHGLSAPYLLNELLALAALHLSRVRPAQSDYYYLHATQLQTHALYLFNNINVDLAMHGGVPAFLFSSFLAVHVLCDTLTCRDGNLWAFLDRLVQYIRLQRGVRTVAGRSWDALSQSDLAEMIHSGPSIPATGIALGKEYADLLGMITTAKLGPSLASQYQRTIEWLQSIADHKDDQGRRPRVSGLVAWAVFVPDEYLESLLLRRPEALVILTYYAVQLHFHRDLWLFEDSGKYLVESISSYLGPEWESWLAWPNRIIQDPCV